MRVCAENGTKVAPRARDVALAQAELLLGEHDDAAAFRRLVGKRGELRRVGELALADAGAAEERRRLAVAERDRSGLVEQQHVDVAGGFHGAAGGRDDVGAQHAADAGQADRREQPADGRRDQAHQQRDQHRDGDRIARLGHLDARKWRTAAA